MCRGERSRAVLDHLKEVPCCQHEALAQAKPLPVVLERTSSGLHQNTLGFLRVLVLQPGHELPCAQGHRQLVPGPRITAYLQQGLGPAFGLLTGGLQRLAEVPEKGCEAPDHGSPITCTPCHGIEPRRKGAGSHGRKPKVPALERCINRTDGIHDLLGHTDRGCVVLRHQQQPTGIRGHGLPRHQVLNHVAELPRCPGEGALGLLPRLCGQLELGCERLQQFREARGSPCPGLHDRRSAGKAIGRHIQQVAHDIIGLRRKFHGLLAPCERCPPAAREDLGVLLWRIGLQEGNQ
mmetsp:Transcript_27700/g.79850  ORF Transcript_27700/g.79850 Transcript_27700/m.79850 type:complete len:293 (-) Transcript_27700:312-1190(-)